MKYTALQNQKPKHMQACYVLNADEHYDLEELMAVYHEGVGFVYEGDRMMVTNYWRNI